MLHTWYFVKESFGCSGIGLNIVTIGGPVKVSYKTGAASTVAHVTVVVLNAININKIVIGANSQVLSIW